MTETPAPNTCRHCGAALDALTRRRGAQVCGAAKCRHLAAQAHTARLKESLSTAAVVAARAQLRHLQADPAPVVWLQHCEPQLTALTAQDRERQRAYLESVVTDGMVIDRSRLAESSADDGHPQGARLCAQCRGRCCEHGAGWRAFIDLTVLQRWQQAQPGSTLADAITAYVSMLPAEHVQDACLYQTRDGCAMPREHRADICNGFACVALQQVQRLARDDEKAAVIAITFHQDRVERAAVIEPDATHTLRLQTPAAPST